MKRFCIRALLLSSLLSVAALAHAEQTPPTDEELAASVQQALNSDAELQTLGLKVSSKKSEVTIEGGMTDDQQMFKAGQIAEKVPGVKFVINNMVPKN
ncbi:MULTISPECIES: BON domain-containing protein [Chromobacterium]|uniref:BON domain-containing protein n=1 Tax=Chromobacterium aquaticum TaxID=467180 RepID=A0ABV8ZNF8_9NEIS|nr:MULTISPECIES: BON domain-containing protein [Chromobacterium]KMN35941.1 hypothetical protein VI26_10200 [Chromobacterium sp. LK1]MCD5362996.1 BON domain-containing protein [Chromobacterium aquaticum]